MTPQFETVETVGQDLDQAHTKIDAARKAMLAIPERGLDVPEFRQALYRLDRVEAELERVESRIAVREGLVEEGRRDSIYRA